MTKANIFYLVDGQPMVKRGEALEELPRGRTNSEAGWNDDPVVQKILQQLANQYRTDLERVVLQSVVPIRG